MIKKTIGVIGITVLIMGFAGFLYSEDGKTEQETVTEETANKENPKEKVIVETKEILGEVSGISGNFLAVAYGRDPQSGAGLEMAFNIDNKVRIAHKRSIRDINFGDTVKVVYEETTTIKEDGLKISQRVAKMVSFVKAAEKKAIVEEKLESVPVEEAIPLKGLKGE
jgi:hypothetical protein